MTVKLIARANIMPDLYKNKTVEASRQNHAVFTHIQRQRRLNQLPVYFHSFQPAARP